MEERIRDVADLAEEAFWAVVAEKFPEATHGDLYFDAEITFREKCEEIITLWVACNTNLLPYHWASEDNEE